MSFKKILIGVVSVILGLTFIFSAYIKIFPIELFEFSFVEIKIANWSTAPFIARIFLALEFFLGILLILNLNGGNRNLAKATVGLLVIFTIYLIAIILVEGNNGNCGCFGTFIKMTPLESIFKNIILLTLTFVLFLSPNSQNYSTSKFVIISVAIASISAPFIINPVSLTKPPSENEINYSLKLDALYTAGNATIPKIDLRKGKVVIAFMSLTCPHCKLGAQKLNIIHNQHPSLPIYFVLNGEKSDLKDFLEESKTKSINYSFMTVKEGFIENAGLNLPSILWVNNSKVENRTKYTELNESALIKWFEH
jgi:thiol-disulfide isomerase/thioredoxin